MLKKIHKSEKTTNISYGSQVNDSWLHSPEMDNS